VQAWGTTESGPGPARRPPGARCHLPHLAARPAGDVAGEQRGRQPDGGAGRPATRGRVHRNRGPGIPAATRGPNCAQGHPRRPRAPGGRCRTSTMPPRSAASSSSLLLLLLRRPHEPARWTALLSGQLVGGLAGPDDSQDLCFFSLAGSRVPAGVGQARRGDMARRSAGGSVTMFPTTNPHNKKTLLCSPSPVSFPPSPSSFPPPPSSS
jgi:hypothetical protein